jgi:hypothetical protein
LLESANLNDTWLSKLRSNLRTRQGWRFGCAVLCFAAAPLCIIIALLPFILIGAEDFAHPEYLFFFAPGVFLFIPLGGYFLRTWRRSNEPTVAEALAKDPRPPIIYLRPFKADTLAFRTIDSNAQLMMLSRLGVWGLLAWLAGFGRAKRSEELLVEVVEALGPVVAIGRPGEKVPQLGATRLYVGDEWKDVVRDYMRRSRLVLMVAGSTPHFAWEIGEVFRNEPFVPTIIMLPFFKSYRQAEVDNFVSAFDGSSGLNAPRDLRKIRAVYFPDRSTMMPIENDGSREEKILNSMNPFLGSLTMVSELIRPGLRSDYLGIAQDKRRRSQQFAWAASAIIACVIAFKLLISL